MTHIVRNVPLAIAVAISLAACSDERSGPLSSQTPIGSELAPLYRAESNAIPGSYIVVLKDNTSVPSITANVGVQPRLSFGVRVADEHGELGQSTSRVASTSSLSGFAAQMDSAEVAVLRQDERVAYIEEDRYLSLEGTQYMDSRGDPWGLDRIDQRSPSLSGSYTYAATGAGVYVYVVDTGIEASHSEFESRVRNVYDAFGGNGADCNGHGTAVAGAVAGKTFGVAKAAYLRGVRVGNCDGSAMLSGLVAALDWIRTNRADPAVVNISMSTSSSTVLNDVVGKLVSSGVFVTAAAGNYNKDACSYSPASAPAVFVVAASEEGDSRASYSNYGSCVDAYAPGTGIRTAQRGGGSVSYQGTSVAAPHAAGAAALYLSRNKGASPGTVDSWLKSSATAGSIKSNPNGTPNRLVYVGSLSSAGPTTEPDPPASWSTRDVGSVSATGSFTQNSDGSLRVSGSGADIWGSSDEFRFGYQTLSGDGEIVARLTSQSNTHSYAKAGVMIRESLSSGSKFAAVLRTPGYGIALMNRGATGGSISRTAYGDKTLPRWIRLVRSGSTLTGYRSSDGSSWTRIGSVNISMNSTVYVGLAVTSRVDGTLGTANFESVRIGAPTSTKAASTSWSTRDVGSVSATGSFTQNSDGSLRVSGSGADIWGSSDEFRYVYQTLSGDGEIVARLTSQSNTHSYAKAGVMIRESLSSGSKFAAVLRTPGYGIALMKRSGTGGSISRTAYGDKTLPRWIRLVRSGSTLTGYRSSDGSSWTRIGSVDVSMNSTVYVGLAVTSRVDGTLGTVDFEDVRVQG